MDTAIAHLNLDYDAVSAASMISLAKKTSASIILSEYYYYYYYNKYYSLCFLPPISVCSSVSQMSPASVSVHFVTGL